MTEQEIFNIVWTGLASQGWKKSFDGIFCAYRGDDGCKCAAGWLIPDDYELSKDDNTTPIEFISFFHENFTEDQLVFIKKLQKRHDGATSIPKYMERSFREFAGANGLTIPA